MPKSGGAKAETKPAAKKAAKKKVVKKKPADKKTASKPKVVRDRQFYIDLICVAISTTDKGMARLVTAFQKDDPDFPSVPTIMRWLCESTAFTEQYMRAREAQADVLADQIIEISDDDSLDIAFKEDGTPFVNTEHIQRSKLRVDARKWIASKLKPKKYGDKVQNELTGADGVPLSIAVEFVKP